jgi:hypothetical protein
MAPREPDPAEQVKTPAKPAIVRPENFKLIIDLKAPAWVSLP